MKKRLTLGLALGLAMMLTLTGCGSGSDTTADSASVETEEAASSSDHATVCTVDLTEGKYSDEKLDDSWDESSAETITLNGDSISSDSKNVTVDGTTATINAAGTYVISGTLDDGQIIVNVESEDSVHIVLNGAEISCSTSAPISIENGDTIITLAEGTENTITDNREAKSETEDSSEDDSKPNAAIYAKDDLTFNGEGSLTVTANYNHAIQSKDDLKFVNGTYTITSAGDAVVGKDSVSFRDGTYTITSGGDGIKATNITDSDKGYVMIDDGTFTITSTADAIQAETLLRVNDGTFTIVSGGGSDNAAAHTDDMGGGFGGKGGFGAMFGGTSTDSDTEDSTKGLKSYVELTVAGGEFEIDSCDDAVHSNQNVTIEDGTFTILAGDDGMHADVMLLINDGTIDIQKSYEGLEGSAITINDGDISIVASDDGLNAATDSDSAFNPEDSMASTSDESIADDTDSTGEMTQPTMPENSDGTTPTMPENSDGTTPTMPENSDGTTPTMPESSDGTQPTMPSGETTSTDGSDAPAMPNGTAPATDGTTADESAAPGMPNQDANTTDNSSEASDAATSDDSTATDTTSDASATSDSTDNSQQGGMQGFGGQMQGNNAMGGGMMGEDDGSALTINGGTLKVSAEGDGLDSNGSLTVTGGTIYVDGPTNGGNGAIDYASTFEITGGTMITIGSDGMEVTPSNGTTQNYIYSTTSSNNAAGTTLTVTDEDGNVIAQMTSEKTFQWYLVTSPDLETGETYSISVGDNTSEVTISDVANEVK